MKWLGGIIVITIIIWLLSGIATIKPDERAFVRRFGEIVAKPGPGLHLGWPLGIDQIDRIQINAIRQVGVGSEDTPLTLITGDQNLLNVTFVIEYSIHPDLPEQFLLQRNRIDVILSQFAESLVQQYVATRPIDELLLAGRNQLADAVKESLPHTDLGIVIQRVSVKLVSPPSEVIESFTQVNEAQNAMATVENQAKQKSQSRIRQAETMLNQTRITSEAYRVESIAAATAEAQAFRTRLAQYQKMKLTTPDILSAIWWDETGRMLLGMKGKGRIELLDSKLGPNGLDLTTIMNDKR